MNFNWVKSVKSVPKPHIVPQLSGNSVVNRGGEQADLNVESSRHSLNHNYSLTFRKTPEVRASFFGSTP